MLTAGFSGHDPHRMMHTYGLHKGHGFDRPKVRPSAGGSASMQLAVSAFVARCLVYTSPPGSLFTGVRGRVILRTSPRDGVLRSHPPVAADDDHSHTQEQEHGAKHYPVGLLFLLTLSGQVDPQPPLQPSSLAHVGASEIVAIDEQVDPEQERDQAITQGVVHLVVPPAIVNALCSPYRIHPSAWKDNSANFRFTEFSEVQLRVAERSRVRRVMSSSCS